MVLVRLQFQFIIYIEIIACVWRCTFYSYTGINTYKNAHNSLRSRKTLKNDKNFEIYGFFQILYQVFEIRNFWIRFWQARESAEDKQHRPIKSQNMTVRLNSMTILWTRADLHAYDQVLSKNSHARCQYVVPSGNLLTAAHILYIKDCDL
jgi:hypothetical protein